MHPGKHDDGFTTLDVIIALFIGLIAFIPLVDTAIQGLRMGDRLLSQTKGIIEARNGDADARIKLFSL